MKRTDIKKAIIIGCPGSGKSTFARALAEKTGLPLIHLDMLYWNADRTTVTRDVFDERLRDAMAGETWIIEGNFGRTMELRMAACDTIFFLDYPVNVCLEGIRARQGMKRPDLPWVEDGEDEEFIEFIKTFTDNEHPKIIERLKNCDKRIITFTRREEADEYLR